ncbi:MAG TPA: DUF6529 family protein [Pseudonocardiaceae bacterium]|nr:DUF6529 family protein [Pseudonocardiaceae bacterium]
MAAQNDPQAPALRRGDSAVMPVLLILGLGVTVAIILAVYGRVHEPTGFALNVAGFSGPQAVKAWLATGAFVLALVQLLSGLAIVGRLGGMVAPPWVSPLHRWSGRLAVLLTVPVVVHCLYALGFQTDTPRVLIHSFLGCFFYGAFTAKMLLLTRRGLPGWAIPLIGGLVFIALFGLWLSSSVWFFVLRGITF